MSTNRTPETDHSPDAGKMVETPTAGQDGGEHTPLPWMQGTRGPNGCPIIGTAKGVMICMLAHSTREPEQAAEAEANVELILSAVNSHNDILRERDALKAEVERYRGVADKITGLLLSEQETTKALRAENDRLRAENAELRDAIAPVVKRWMNTTQQTKETYPKTFEDMENLRAMLARHAPETT